MRITEAQLRTIIRESLNPSSTQPLYTGVIISDPKALRKMIYTLGLDRTIEGWATSNIAAHGNEQLNHHMTLTPGALKGNDPLRDMLGAPVDLQLTAWGVDPELGIAAWLVQPPEGIPVRSGVPHITAALADPRVKPHLAARIRDWQSLPVPIPLSGILAEVFPVPR